MITATEAIQGSTPNAAKGLGTRRDRIVYWTTTGIVCAVMVFSIVNFTFIDRFPFSEGLRPSGIAQLLQGGDHGGQGTGVLALLVPGVPTKIKEFAISGSGSPWSRPASLILHWRCEDQRSVRHRSADFPGLLVVSYMYFNKLKAAFPSLRT